MQLLVAVRKAEAEVSDSKMGTMIIKAKAATVNDKLASLKQQVSDLVAVVKAKHVQENPKKTTQQNEQKNDSKGRRTQIFGTNQYFNTAGQSNNNQSTQPLGTQSAQQCYQCWGWGHMAKECATPLNYLKGGVPMSHPPKVKEIKGSKKLIKLNQNRPYYPQNNKRMISYSRPNS